VSHARFLCRWSAASVAPPPMLYRAVSRKHGAEARPLRNPKSAVSTSSTPAGGDGDGDGDGGASATLEDIAAMAPPRSARCRQLGCAAWDSGRKDRFTKR
jgi:hypothetical protein